MSRSVLVALALILMAVPAPVFAQKTQASCESICAKRCSQARGSMISYCQSNCIPACNERRAKKK
jgi:predicted S18 family serine protease